MKMIKKQSWEDFRETGLLLFINQILQPFGWCIVYDFDDNTGELSSVYPARTIFRGFDTKSIRESYEKINKNFFNFNLEKGFDDE